MRIKEGICVLHTCSTHRVDPKMILAHVFSGRLQGLDDIISPLGSGVNSVLPPGCKVSDGVRVSHLAFT